MFGIGLPELFIILVIALVVLGPDKLPDLARAIGRGVGEFRKATDELKATINSDDELRELKENLTQAKSEMGDVIRESTQGVNVEDVTNSLADGSFFGEKAGDEEDGETEDDTEKKELSETPDDLSTLNETGEKVEPEETAEAAETESENEDAAKTQTSESNTE